MGLEYLYKEGEKSCSRDPLKVKFDGHDYGEIRKLKNNQYQHFPEDSKTGGATFAALSAVQRNLQETRPAREAKTPVVSKADTVNKKTIEEINKLKKVAKETESIMARAEILLTAAFDLLDLQKKSKETLDLLEQIVRYDDSDCDGHSLHEDIAELLESM